MQLSEDAAIWWITSYSQWANVNSIVKNRNNIYTTHLILARKRNNRYIVEKLLASGTDPTLQLPNGKYPLTVALLHGHGDLRGRPTATSLELYDCLFTS